MTRAAAAALAGVLTLVAMSACGSVEQAGRGSATTTPAPTATRTSPMPTPPEDLTVPPKSTGGKTSMVRVSGIVSDGVEPGCKLLTSNGVVYLLIWRNAALVSGQTIEVEGTVQPDLATTCQQGTPLVVKRVLTP